MKHIIDNSENVCDEIINATKIVSTSMTNTVPTNMANTTPINVTSTVSIHSDNKKVTCKTK